MFNPVWVYIKRPAPAQGVGTDHRVVDIGGFVFLFARAFSNPEFIAPAELFMHRLQTINPAAQIGRKVVQHRVAINKLRISPSPRQRDRVQQGQGSGFGQVGSRCASASPGPRACRRVTAAGWKRWRLRVRRQPGSCAAQTSWVRRTDSRPRPIPWAINPGHEYRGPNDR
jgi:hypothetical protein